jgi:predicted ATPase
MRRNAGDAPLLFVLTSRAVPADTPTWLEGVAMVPLANLGGEGIRRMVSSMLGTEDVDTGFLTRMAELSEGNPFYLERLLEHLVQAELLTNRAGRWNTAIELVPDQLPRDLRALVLRQLTALSSSAMTVAKAGAVAQRAFSLDLMKKVTRFEDEVLFEAFDSLAAHQVVQPDGEGAYRFAQDQVKELLYESLEVEERRGFHQALAEALESDVAGRPVTELPLDLVTAIADHYLLAGVDAKTVTYALAAGIRHSALLGNAAAERFLSAGLDLARTGDDTLALFDYLQHLGDVKRRTGPYGEAKTLLAEAVAIAETAAPRQLGRLLTSLAKTHMMLSEYQDAIRLSDRSTAVCLEAGDPSGASRSLVTGSRLRFFTGDTAGAIALGEQAVSLAIDASDRSAMGAAYALLGYLYVAAMPERLEMGVEHLDRALSLLLQDGDRIGLKNAYNLLGNAQNALGDFQRARESYVQEQRLCVEAGLAVDSIYPLLNLGITAYDMGEFARAVDHATQAKAILQKIDSKNLLGLVLASESLPAARLGQLAHAQASMAVAAALADDDKNKYLKTLVLQNQLELGLFLGQLTEAAQAGELLASLIAETGNTEPEGRMHVLMAEVRGREGQMEQAKWHVENALQVATRTHAKGIRAMALTAKAWIALREKDWEAARLHGTSALELARQIGAGRTLGDALGILGEAALATGQGDAEAHFNEMATLSIAMRSPDLQALALFGQAAAKPYAATATDLVRQAQQLLQSTAEDLTVEMRPGFHCALERARVLEGNFIAFGFRQAEAARPAQALMPGMGFGGMW